MAQPGKPDPKLVQKAAQGNRKAFKALFDLNFQAVYNFALTLSGDPAMAEDITQETFIRAHKNLPSLGPPWNFRAWVFRLARNYFIDQIRKDRDLYSLEEDVQVTSPRPGPEREKISQDAADSVYSTLGMLSVRQREILVLRELQGFSYAEIGEILELSSSNVKVSLHRARTAFAESYGNQLLLEDPSGDCIEVVELLHAYHDQEDLLDRERFVKEHLKNCQECQERRKTLIAQSVAFGAFIPVIPPKELAQRILKKTTGAQAVSGQKKSGKLKKVLIAGGGALILSGMAWIVYSMAFNPNSILPNFPDKGGGQNSPTGISGVLPESVNNPTSTPKSMNSYSGPVQPPSYCDLFERLEISTVFLNIRENNLSLPMYFKFPDGVPGLEVEVPDFEGPWEYEARLGSTDSGPCSIQGYDDRLYCLFMIEESMANTYQELFLFLEGCPKEVYFTSKVSIPDLQPVCSRDLPRTFCEAAGGIYREPLVIPSFCDCP